MFFILLIMRFIPPKDCISKISIRKRVYGFGRGPEELLELLVLVTGLFLGFIVSPPTFFSKLLYEQRIQKGAGIKPFKNKQNKDSNIKKGDFR